MTLLYKLFLTFATDVRKNLHLVYWSDKKANELNIEFSPKFWLQVEQIQFKYQFCKIVENRSVLETMDSRVLIEITLAEIIKIRFHYLYHYRVAQ